jgi:NADP-dependent 3-hydroxy acid dehydrogenase YdfG
MSLKDKVAIITGASSGIGAATAVLFSKLGASLVLTGRNERALDETISNCDESSKERVSGEQQPTNLCQG